MKSFMDKIREEQLKRAKEQQAMPSVLDMGKNLVETAVNTVKSAVNGEGIGLTEEEANRRLSICEQCEHYTGSRCSQCGCYMATKTYLKAATCPVGKW